MSHDENLCRQATKILNLPTHIHAVERPPPKQFPQSSILRNNHNNNSSSSSIPTICKSTPTPRNERLRRIRSLQQLAAATALFLSDKLLKTFDVQLLRDLVAN